MQQFFGILIILLLLLMAVLFGRRQLLTLQWLKAVPRLSPEDRAYFRRQAWRRLLGCGLMVILAVMVVGLFFVDRELERFITIVDDAKAQGVRAELTPEDRDTLSFFFGYLGIVALVVLLMTGLALLDLMAIRRYGMRQSKDLRAARLAALEREVAEFRRSRNGSPRR